jgi:hypothetical protein
MPHNMASIASLLALIFGGGSGPDAHQQTSSNFADAADGALQEERVLQHYRSVLSIMYAGSDPVADALEEKESDMAHYRTLICGPMGGGKTTLLNLVQWHFMKKNSDPRHSDLQRLSRNRLLRNNAQEECAECATSAENARRGRRQGTLRIRQIIEHGTEPNRYGGTKTLQSVIELPSGTSCTEHQYSLWHKWFGVRRTVGERTVLSSIASSLRSRPPAAASAKQQQPASSPAKDVPMQSEVMVSQVQEILRQNYGIKYVESKRGCSPRPAAVDHRQHQHDEERIDDVHRIVMVVRADNTQENRDDISRSFRALQRCIAGYYGIGSQRRTVPDLHVIVNRSYDSPATCSLTLSDIRGIVEDLGIDGRAKWRNNRGNNDVATVSITFANLLQRGHEVMDLLERIFHDHSRQQQQATPETACGDDDEEIAEMIRIT